MKRLRKNLIRASYAVSWVTVGLVIACALLDRSGWIADSIRGRVTRALPGLDVEIGVARVLWFRPGIVLEDVRLRAEEGHLNFEVIEVRFAPATGLASLVDEIEIRGGDAEITDELTRAIRDVIENREQKKDESEDDEAATASSTLPIITLTDFSVALVLPSEAAIPVGRVDLKLEDAGDQKHLSGRLLPHLAGSIPEAAVHIGGSLAGDQLDVHASARRLPVDTAKIPPALFPAAPVFERGTALLSLSFEGGLNLAVESNPFFEARVEFAEGEVELSLTEESVRLDNARADLSWFPEKTHGLWTKSAWRGLTRIESSWDGTSVEVLGRFGQSAGPDGLKAWVWIPEFPLGSEQTGHASLGPMIDDIMQTYGLSGAASVSVGCRVPTFRPGAELANKAKFLVEVHPRPSAGFRYEGFADGSGERQGIPLPANNIGGHVAISVATAHERPTRMAFVGLNADLPHGRAEFDGVVWSPAPARGPDAPAEYQMELFVPSLAIDTDLRDALAEMSATDTIWEEYGPAGEGELSSRWRFYSTPDTNGLTAWGQVDFEAESMRWKSIPLPLDDVAGQLSMLWGERGLDVLDAEPGTTWRPFGMELRATGQLATGAEMATLIKYREEAPQSSSMTWAQLPKSGTHEHEVRLDDLAMQGPDFDVLVDVFPVLAGIAESTGLEGTANVSYRGSANGPGDPYRFDIDVEPSGIGVTPVKFPVPFSDLRGRVLISGVQAISPEQQSSSEYAVSVRGALAAISSEGFTATGVPRFETGTPLTLTAHCAGVDPSDPELLRAFKIALEIDGDEPSLEDSAALGGKIDGVLEITVPDEEVGPPSVAARVEFRHNSLSAGSFQLDDITGTATLEGSVLRGSSLRARMASSPVELVDFRLVPHANLDELEEPDRMLADPSFLVAADGLIVQSGLRARDFALSEENLALFLDQETVDSLLADAQLRGRIDFEDTRLVLVPDGNNGLKLGMHGVVVPHNLVVKAGLPIQVSSGHVEIDELRIEEGLTRARGHVTDLFGRIAGRQIEKIAMLATLRGSHLSIENLSGTLEGGSITSLESAGGSPALSVNLQEPHFFSAAIELGATQRVDANGLLRGLFETSITDKGKTSGWLRVAGRPDDVLGLRGSGAVEVREAQLWSIPVIRSLFGQLGFDSTAQFDRMESKLRLENGVLSMIDMDVRSPILHVVGSGTIDFDGRLHHDLEIKYTLINLLGPFKVLLYWIQNSILRVAVRGTMWRPEVVLRNGIRDLFSGDPEDTPSLPLPGFSPMPTRF